jgi:S1-C subfamily serine protease
VQLLLKALAGGAAVELSTLCLGGNKVSTAGMALSQWLKSMRDSVLVDWKPQLRDAKSMCTVGTVYLNSPAQTAGLRSGDSLVAFGPVQHADFQSVAETVVPIVKANVGKPIDVVVVRLDETAQVHQVALTLTPKSWSGAGLLGCILK